MIVQNGPCPKDDDWFDALAKWVRCGQGRKHIGREELRFFVVNPDGFHWSYAVGVTDDYFWLGDDA